MVLQLFWRGYRGDINGRDMIFRCRCVFLKKISNGKIRYFGWVGGVGKDDSMDNLGRGGVEFL